MGKKQSEQEKFGRLATDACLELQRFVEKQIELGLPPEAIGAIFSTMCSRLTFPATGSFHNLGMFIFSMVEGITEIQREREGDRDSSPQ